MSHKPTLEGVDKIMRVSESEIWVLFTHRSPVVITGPDAMAIYLWMMTPTPLTLTEFVRAAQCESEDTNVIFAA